MHWIDWAIVVVLLVFITAVALNTRQFTRSVADYLAANRCAGRYLLCIASEISALGMIAWIGAFEMYYKAGFVATWWGVLATPIWLCIGLTGWVVYRLRETRALTMPQFIEMRYGRRFRVFFGVIGWTAGMATFGIFPAVGARFFIYFCGLPEQLSVLGVAVSSYVAIMFVLLAISLFFALIGGQISVMVTDFIQGMFCNIVFLIVLVVVLTLVPWDRIISTMQTEPPDASLLNPYRTSMIEDFNIWYFVIANIVAMYMFKTWQGAQGYGAAARNPHEAKMAGILGMWRGLIQDLLRMMMPIGAYVVMKNAAYGDMALQVNTTLGTIGNAQLQKQMVVPLALSQMLPVAVKGLFCATMLASFIASANTCLHSFGGLMVQDVILPFRGKPMNSREHLRLLRGATVVVAVIIFLFSYLYRQVDYVYMFTAAAGAIFSGAGAAIVGGLYWKKGTVAGAWCGMIVGGLAALFGLTLQQTWPQLCGLLLEWFPTSAILRQHAGQFPLSGIWISFVAVLCAVGSYIAGSLLSKALTGAADYNLDQMLHRGPYAIAGEHLDDDDQPARGWRTLIPTDEFTRGDKIIYWSSFSWMMIWFVVFILITLLSFSGALGNGFWPKFWFFKLVLIFSLGTGVTVWFLIGGIRDMRDMYRVLRTAARDKTDDGSVA